MGMPVRRRLASAYLECDPRSLALGRMALAMVLLLDLARRVPSIDLYYTNEGLLPNHTVLWRPQIEHVFSFFFMASHRHEAFVGFVLTGVAYSLLFVGYRTKLAQLASLLAVLSLHGRTQFVQNGGDIVLAELCLWTLFLPLGRAYSLDALARGVKDRRPVVSLGMLALLLQLATIYAFNALQKSGTTWREGSVVHYMLHQDGILTHFGLWVRGFLSPAASVLLTRVAFYTEAALPFCLLAPWPVAWARRLAIVLVAGLHLGFGAFLNLGVFVPAMLAFTPFLLPSLDAERLERFAMSGARLRAAVEHLATLAHRHLLQRPHPEKAGAAGPHGEGSRAARYLPSVVLGALLAVAGCQVLIDNPVTKVESRQRPRAAAIVVEYLQLLQAWSMYAPEVPTTDTNVFVDAVTREGRRVDPWNERLSPGAPRPGPRIPPRLGQDALGYAYALRIPFQPAYFPAFGEWILRYPERTGRPGDEIVRFEVFAVEDDSPPPGEREPRHVRVRTLFAGP